MNFSKSDRPKLDSLQALRAWAFLGIFFLHAGFFIDWAELGVSTFFVMSGFLMEYRYDNTDFAVSFRDNLSFSLKKIRKLYPLHIITMLLALLIVIISTLSTGVNFGAIMDIGFKTALNVTLMQTWVPFSYINTSLNGVAWYLSVTMFLYFMYPCIKRIIEHTPIFRLYVICGVILLAEVISCIPFIILVGNDSPTYIWFMYTFPVFRLGDFFIGCVLKRIFCEGKKRSIESSKATVIEILTVLVTVFVFILLRKEPGNVILLALHNWTTVYIPLAAAWVMLFAVNKGALTRMLSNKVAMFIGNISAYAFLIHYVTTMYFSVVLSNSNIEVHGLGRGMLVFAELIVSIVLSVAYKLIHEKALFYPDNKKTRRIDR